MIYYEAKSSAGCDSSMSRRVNKESFEEDFAARLQETWESHWKNLDTVSPAKILATILSHCKILTMLIPAFSKKAPHDQEIVQAVVDAALGASTLSYVLARLIWEKDRE